MLPPDIDTPSAIDELEPLPYDPSLTDKASGSLGRIRYVVDDVNVRLAVERSQYLNVDGKLITEDYRVLLKNEIKSTLKAEFGTLTDFLRRWSNAGRKQAVLEQLAAHGIPFETQQQDVAHGSELDAFDLVTHVTFDQKPLTLRERVNNVKSVMCSASTQSKPR